MRQTIVSSFDANGQQELVKIKVLVIVLGDLGINALKQLCEVHPENLLFSILGGINKYMDTCS